MPNGEPARKQPAFCSWCGAYRDHLGWTEACVPTPEAVPGAVLATCPTCRAIWREIFDRKGKFFNKAPPENSGVCSNDITIQFTGPPAGKGLRFLQREATKHIEDMLNVCVPVEVTPNQIEWFRRRAVAIMEQLAFCAALPAPAVTVKELRGRALVLDLSAHPATAEAWRVLGVPVNDREVEG